MSKVVWWLMSRDLPRFNWARQTIREDGSVEVADCDGKFHEFSDEESSRHWLYKDGFMELEALTSDDLAKYGLAPDQLQPPEYGYQSDGLREFLATFAEKVQMTPNQGDVEEIRLFDFVSNTPSLDLIFSELKKAPLLKRLDFESETISNCNNQEVIEALAKHGPFLRLQTLEIFNLDFIDPKPITSLVSLEKSTPNLISLDICTNETSHFGGPLRLEKLEKLYLDEMSLTSLKDLSGSFLPNLKSLEIEIYQFPEDSETLVKSALHNFFHSNFAPKLEVAMVTVFTPNRAPSAYVWDAALESLPGSDFLKGLRTLRFLAQISKDQMIRLREQKDAFGALERFQITDDALTWSEIQETVGDWVAKPARVREKELFKIETIPVDLREADRQQRELSLKISRKDLEDTGFRYVAGMAGHMEGERAHGAVVVMDVTSGDIVETAEASHQPDFPYEPGYEAYREGPALLEAFSHLEHRPDLLIVDGHGIAHPRDFGLACHIGLKLDLPTIGCTGTFLYGIFEQPGQEACDATALNEEREGKYLIGMCVRTQPGQEPLFVSPGHKISIKAAANKTLELSPRHRFPEPLQLAHHLLKKNAP